MSIHTSGEERRPGASRLLTAAAEVLAMAGAMAMFAAAVLVCVSVGLRWYAGNSVPGDFEIVQISVALAAFAFLPYCQERRGNIFVSTFTSSLPRAVQNTLDALWDLLWAGFAALIAWRLAVGARETIASSTTTMVTGLPIGWAMAACAVMAGFLAIVSIATAARIRRGRP